MGGAARCALRDGSIGRQSDWPAWRSSSLSPTSFSCKTTGGCKLTSTVGNSSLTKASSSAASTKPWSVRWRQRRSTTRTINCGTCWPRTGSRLMRRANRCPARARPRKAARGAGGDTPPWGWLLPVVLVVLSFFVLMGFETGYAIHDRDALAEQWRLQEPVVQEALKLRQKLEALAGKTAQFAAEGNEGAKSIVDQMKRQGVTLAAPSSAL